MNIWKVQIGYSTEYVTTYSLALAQIEGKEEWSIMRLTFVEITPAVLCAILNGGENVLTNPRVVTDMAYLLDSDGYRKESSND